MPPKIPYQSRICIIGAGPAGLSHAHYLRKAGYNNVTVLEADGKVGGKCESLTFNHRSFDMGANYLTPDYVHIMRMAREVGAEMYTEKHPIVFNPVTRRFSKLFKAVTEGTTTIAFLWSALRYFWLRWKLNSVLPKAGNMGLADNADLMVTFDEWLDRHELGNLRRIFSIPVTMMGYGRLDEVAAPYVLRYIGLGTFRTMLLFGAGLSLNYPKRFKDGFQRFWERVSWQLDVRTGVRVSQVIRNAEGVRVRYTETGLPGELVPREPHEEQYDYLVLSCPLTLETLEPFLDLQPAERAQFCPEKVKHNLFGITLLDGAGFRKKYRVFHIFPLAEINHPSIFAHQFPDNPAFEIYIPMSANFNTDGQDGIDMMKQRSVALVRDLGANSSESDILHYDLWRYFFHVDLIDFKAGYYDQLEDMQGVNRTFYNMGLNSFELIEPIARYSKHLVDRYYEGD